MSLARHQWRLHACVMDESISEEESGRRRRRRAPVALAGALVVALILLVSNMAGAMPYPGGPLRDPENRSGWLWLDIRPANKGSGGVAGSDLARGELIYTALGLHNDSSWAVTVERIELVDVTGALRLVDARLARPGTSGGVAGLVTGDGPEIAALRLDSDYVGLPAVLAANNTPGEGRLTIVTTTADVGHAGYGAVAINYRMGPFSFRVVYDQQLKICAGPLPAGTECTPDQL